MNIKTIGKVLGLAVALSAICPECDAQALGIELNGGLQGMHYSLSGGQSQLLPGGSLGLTYTFPMGNRWGIRTGILGGIYRTQATLKDGTAFTYNEVDDAGSAFRYSVMVTGYKETQQFFAAEIPLLLHFQTGGEGMQWYFDAGGKMVFPFNSSTSVSAQQLSLSGYYPDFHIIITNLPQHGFGTLNNWKSTSSTAFKPSGALSAATGVSFATSSSTRLYIGVYADYGLTDLKENHDSMPIVTYSSSGIGNVKAGSVLNMANTGAATLLSYGVQVRLSFGSAKKKSAGPAKNVVEPVNTKPVSAARDSVTPAPPKTDSALATTDSKSLDSLIREHEAEDARHSEEERTHRSVVFGIIGETVIPETQKAKLDQLVSLLKEHPDLRISIEGHFCDSLLEMENSQTAAARAKAVEKYLENSGISRRRMDIGYARKSDPVLSYDPAANYRNRRVSIAIIGSF